MNKKNNFIEDEGEFDQSGQEDPDEFYGSGPVDKDELAKLGQTKEEEPQPVEGKTKGYLIGPPVGARFPRKEWEALLKLKELYGFDNVPDTLRMAVLDAQAYQKGDQNKDSSGALAERLDRLSAKIDALTMSPTAETQAPEEEEEASSLYNPEAIAYFESLDSKGKAYLTKQLKGNPNERHLGGYSALQREINAHINKVAPHDGYHRSAPATRQARRGLYDFLVQEKILPK